MAGISVKDLVAEDAPVASAKPKSAKKPGVSVAGLQPADDRRGNLLGDLVSADEQIRDRFIKGVGEIPGTPADALSLEARYMPDWLSANMPLIAPLLMAEKARQAKEGANSPVPLGTENFSRMEQDWLGLPKPAKPKGELEREVGNVSEFAGGSLGPGGIGRDALLGALTGGTALTGAQEIAPDNELLQLFAALAGGHAPRAVASTASRVGKVLPALRSATTPGREAIVGETLGRQTSSAAPQPAKPAASSPEPAAATRDYTPPNLFAPTSPLGANDTLSSIAPGPVRTGSGVFGDMPTPTREVPTATNDNGLPSREFTVDGTKIRPAVTGIPGVKPTLAQARGDENLLALQEHAASRDPKLATALARREAENKTGARTALEGIRGSGTPAAATEHAAAMTREAEQAAAAERATIRTQKDQAALSDTARDRLDRIRETTRKEETRLWNVFRERGDQANVPVGPLRESLQNWLKQQDIVPEMPAEVERALKQFEGAGGQVNVTKIQALRPELRELRQAAEAAGDAKSARIYSGLEDVVGRYLDRITFRDPELQQAYQAARDFTKQRVAIFKLPKEMRAVMGSDAQGADRVTAGSTLKRFIKSGPEGRDSIRQLLAADSSPEMQRTVADYLAAEMPDNATAAAKWLKNHEPMLREMGGDGPASWYDRFNAIVDRQAALEALRASPLGKLNNVPPEKAIQAIMKDVDPVKTAKTLRSQMADNPAAWAGMQRAFADEIISQITDINAKDLNDRPTILPGDLKRLTHEQGTIARVFLGDRGVKTLEAIDQALQQVNRKATSGVLNPKGALPSVTGHRFLDKIVERLADPNTGAGVGIATGAGVGSALTGGSIIGPGSAIGAMGGYGAHLLAHSVQEPLQELFRQALMNPEVGNALMHTASVKSMPAVPKEVRPFFRSMLPTSQGAVAATAGSPKKDKPKPQRVSMAEPSRTLPDGMGFLAQRHEPAPGAAPDSSRWTGMGGPGQGGQIVRGNFGRPNVPADYAIESQPNYAPGIRGSREPGVYDARDIGRNVAGEPMSMSDTPARRTADERKAREGLQADADRTGQPILNTSFGDFYPNTTAPAADPVAKHAPGHFGPTDRNDALPPDMQARLIAPIVPAASGEPARLTKHPVSAEAFERLSPQAQKHLLDALMTPGGFLDSPEARRDEARRQQLVAENRAYRHETGQALQREDSRGLGLESRAGMRDRRPLLDMAKIREATRQLLDLLGPTPGLKHHPFKKPLVSPMQSLDNK